MIFTTYVRWDVNVPFFRKRKTSVEANEAGENEESSGMIPSVGFTAGWIAEWVYKFEKKWVYIVEKKMRLQS